MMMNRVLKGLRLVPLLTVAAAIGCSVGDEKVTEPTFELSKLPWKLTLNHHSVITTKNTPVQLSYEVTNIKGERLTNIPDVVYTASDTSVHIDATGKVTASNASSLRFVYARIHDPEGNWTVADTARFSIEETVFAFDKFKMALSTDTVVPMNISPTFQARLFYANGDTVRNPAAPGATTPPSVRTPTAYYVSTALANVWYQGTSRWTNRITPKNFGTTTIYATSHIFGQDYRDSIKLRSIYPDSVVINVHRVSYSLDPSPSAISQPDITILQNGKVNFLNGNTTASTDIVFDNQAGVINGNIPNPAGWPGSIVTFPNVGKFTYKSAALGPNFKGTITVIAR